MGIKTKKLEMKVNSLISIHLLCMSLYIDFI